MPPVKKRSKASSKKKTPARRGAKKKNARTTGYSGFISGLWSGMVTYSAVLLCVLALGVFVMLAAGGYLANIGERFDRLSSSIAKSAGFVVNRVSAKGQGDLTDREIMEALRDSEHGEVLGRSLLNLDVEQLRFQIEALPRVKTAAVQKLWPDTVHVTIIEREPIAMWQDKTMQFHLVDREGEILDLVEDNDRSGYFVITGTSDPTSAMDVLTALEKHPELFERTASITGVNDRRFDIRFRNNFTAKLPEEGVESALERLDGLGAGTGRLSESLHYLDLRDPRWAYFQPKS